MDDRRRARLIFDAAVGWLRERLVLLPGVSTLTRLVAAERDAATKRVWETLAALLTREQACRLDSLLVVPEGAAARCWRSCDPGRARCPGEAWSRRCIGCPSWPVSG